MRLFQHDSTLQCRNSFQKSSSMPKIAGFMTAAAAVLENVPKSGKLEVCCCTALQVVQPVVELGHQKS